MKPYAPAIGQINFKLSSIDSIQNTENLIPGGQVPFQPEDEAMTPLAIAQYMLYDREQPNNNFGIEDSTYLGYKGGFITQNNKIDIKQSDLFVTGTFTVNQRARLFKDVNMSFNRITNAQRLGSLVDDFNILRFVSNVYNNNFNDNMAMTVGDVREFSYVKGMIILWSGTYADLTTRLPYWRLCARPDLGTVNGVVVPDLEGRFILGGGYSNTTDRTTNTYQPTDNISRSFGEAVNLSIGYTGGTHAVSLAMSEMPEHNHNVQFEIAGGTHTTNSTTNNFVFYRGGGIFSLSQLGTNPVNASNQCMYGPRAYPSAYSCGCGPANGCATQVSCGFSVFNVGSSIKKVTIADFTSGTLSIVNPQIVGGIDNTQVWVGKSVSHENRPPFYVGAYIIYVGQGR
jgi:hypothetical protein